MALLRTYLNIQLHQCVAKSSLLQPLVSFFSSHPEGRVNIEAVT